MVVGGRYGVVMRCEGWQVESVGSGGAGRVS